MVAKRILMIGLGPSGGLLAANLAKLDCEVYGVDVWEEHRSAIEREGIDVVNDDSPPARLAGVLSSVRDCPAGEIDFAVIAVKTPALPVVVEQLLALGGGFRVVCLQNGIDNEEFVAESFERDRVLRVAVNYAGRTPAPGQLQMTFFNRPNYVGCLCSDELCDDVKEFAELMTAAGLDTTPTPDIRRYTWRKTILNASLSAISALTGMTIAEVMHDRESSRLVRAVLEESTEVAARAGYDYGSRFIEECWDYLLRAGHHKPTMAVDLEMGRGTEIDFINAKIVAYAEKLEVPVPVNKTLTALVRAREANRLI